MGGHHRDDSKIRLICFLLNKSSLYFILLTPIQCSFQDDYSQYGIQEFSNHFRSSGGCVAFHLTIPKSPTAAEIQDMADILQISTANVVVAFAAEGQLWDLFLEVSVSVYMRNREDVQHSGCIMLIYCQSSDHKEDSFFLC